MLQIFNFLSAFRVCISTPSMGFIQLVVYKFQDRYFSLSQGLKHNARRIKLYLIIAAFLITFIVDNNNEEVFYFFFSK